MQFKGKRIFVVDDEPTARNILSAILVHDGALIYFNRFEHEASVSEQILQWMPIDLIILDLRLPKGVTGYDVFKQIQTVPELLTIPIIATTAFHPSEHIERTKAMGFNGLISKPIRVNVLRNCVSQVLDGNSVWS